MEGGNLDDGPHDAAGPHQVALAKDGHLAGVAVYEAEDAAHGGGLAGAVGTEEAVHIAFVHGEIEVLDRWAPGEALLEPGGGSQPGRQTTVGSGEATHVQRGCGIRHAAPHNASTWGMIRGQSVFCSSGSLDAASVPLEEMMIRIPAMILGAVTLVGALTACGGEDNCGEYVDYMCACHEEDDDFDCEELRNAYENPSSSEQDDCAVELDDQKAQGQGRRP